MINGQSLHKQESVFIDIIYSIVYTKLIKVMYLVLYLNKQYVYMPLCTCVCVYICMFMI